MAPLGVLGIWQTPHDKSDNRATHFYILMSTKRSVHGGKVSTTILSAAVAFTVGFVWGFRKPTGYCSMSTAQQHGFGNRLTSGLINGTVLGGIVAVSSYVALQ